MQIKIKNFGPIKDGYQNNNGWLSLNKITVFIGTQGSGKSTITKLVATLIWIEKALVRGDFKEKDMTLSKFKKQCEYQNIVSYFTSDTQISYKGTMYFFEYQANNLSIVKQQNNDAYQMPKLMYVPAERNFVGAVSNVRELKGLPSTLYTFADEFVNAAESLKDKEINLPISEARFLYQRLNKTASIVGDGYKIKLSESSSGFQSFVPLFLVTHYLAMSINENKDASVKTLSIEEERRIKKEIQSILSNNNLSEEVKKATLEQLSARFKNTRFVNIVEEPEQNLFPTSQRKVLNCLLTYANKISHNNLIITTHSPYIISYLSIAIQGATILKKLPSSSNHNMLKEQLHKIVPTEACIMPENVTVYELTTDGTIKKLADYEGIPSDNNFLNAHLSEGNKLFDQLLTIEEEL